jgi:cytochrome P450
MLNPAFSVQSTRALVPLMAVPGHHLRDHWLKLLKSEETTKVGENNELTELIISNDLSLATLDVIGLAGFGQDLKSLEYSGTPEQNKLSQAYLHLFSSDMSIMRVLGLLFPFFRNIPTERNLKIRRDVRWLEEESKALVQAGIERAKAEKEAGITSSKPKDLLALMVGLIDEETGKGFTAEELRNQCLTFLAAG